MENRIIKFREWAVASKVMFYPDSEDGWYLNSGEVSVLLNTILMQFTGLLDRNGKEIYEGDVLGRLKRPLFEKPDGTMEKAVVEFIRGEFGGRPLGDTSDHLTNVHFFTAGNPYPYEVIGNIYENPELLTKPN